MAIAMQLGSWLASIPSPSSNAVHIGPLQLRAYGAMIGIGILIAVWYTQRRWARVGGNPDDVVSVVLWAVPAGVIGARFYHVVTDLQRFEGQWWRVVAIWEGGLGIFGGLVAGTLTGLWVARRRGMDVPLLLDAAAPALPIAQAFGRWGNWFNQELFGRPTDLPWGLRIDALHRPARFADIETFHPTFLYESLWNFSLAALLTWVGATGRLRRGYLFALYAAGYATGRIIVESFRIDPTQELGGIRVNFLVAGTVLVGALALVAFGIRRGGTGSGGSDTTADDAIPPDDDAAVEETPADTGSGGRDASDSIGNDTDESDRAADRDTTESDATEGDATDRVGEPEREASAEIADRP